MNQLVTLFAIYTSDEAGEHFLGQAYLSEKDLQAIDQSFEEQLQEEYFITLKDGEQVAVGRIDSIEELPTEDD
ncbi:hypothetical protein AAC978_07355 [Desulfitobacterium sp. THU1]|uniref:hypothetical protein n=1 Tax=Desulfitobacterium sp. THU1 TaxID=3138072 RepID=UPI00311D9BA7